MDIVPQGNLEQRGSSKPNRRTGTGDRRAILFVLCLLLLRSSFAGSSRGVKASSARTDISSVQSQATGHQPGIPHEARGSSLSGTPIWAEAENSTEGTVALFRYRFAIPSAVVQAELSVIADTRYEVWLDGKWLGRGPARFSRVRQEFDTYSIEEPETGSHVIAILVQYAPNVRRSESLQATLQASLRGWDGSAWQSLAATDTTWKAIISPAWDADAQLISQLDLIGPMELLELRQLPVDWMEPGFDDTTWPSARKVTPTPFPALSARTIPPLDNVPRFPQAIVESGTLSPGWQLVELEASTNPHTLVVTATVPTTLALEALEADPIRVDGGGPLAWQPLNVPRRPDVLVAEQTLAPGSHTLEIESSSLDVCSSPTMTPNPAEQPWAGLEEFRAQAEGRTLAIRLAGLKVAGRAGIAPTHDPGRRTLLANPDPGGPAAPVVMLTPTGAEVTIPQGDTPRYLVLDFGRTVHARLSLMADGPAGTIVDAGWDERLTEGRPLPNPGSLVSNLWSQVDSWVLDGTPRQLTTLDTRAGRYLIIQVFGPGPISLSNIQALEETYPVQQVGSFSSSDARLNQIWQIGVDTLIPNMTDAYTDTPWRERGQWWADAMIAFQVDRAAFGDLLLFRRGLRQMADAVDTDGRPEPLAPNGSEAMLLDFGMLWIEGLHLYWTLSDDLELVAELYPTAQRLVGFLADYKGSDGLLDIPAAHWSQSALIDWPAASSRSGESTALNAQYAAILHQMSEMAKALGHDAQAESYSNQSQAVRESINKFLFLPGQGNYAASRLNGKLVPPSPHAEAWALRYDIVPPEYRFSTAQSLIRQLSPFFDQTGRSAVEPLGMSAVLDALAQTNHTGQALSLIREQYGALLDQGATTWWELYTPNQHRGHSLSHSWGSSPTWFLSSHVLGGTATGPSRWQVAPHPGDLESAEGAIPLDSGLLSIDWKHPRCGQFLLNISAPQDSQGNIQLPITRRDAHVVMDGKTIWADGPIGGHSIVMIDDGLLITEVAGGKHEITSSFTCYSTVLPYLPARDQ